MVTRRPLVAAAGALEEIPVGDTVPGNAVVYGSSAASAVEGNDARVTGDQAAATASIRTLGTGGLQASPGDHDHGISYRPADHGLLAWAFDPALAGVAGTLSANATVYLVKLLPIAGTATKLYWYVTTAGATPTAGRNEVGLYSAAGTLLTATNVDSSISASGLKTTTITGQALAVGAPVWVGLVFNATTPPTLARGTTMSTGSLTNVGLAAAGYRFATNGTAANTLPASITPGTNAFAPFALWAALGS